VSCNKIKTCHYGASVAHDLWKCAIGNLHCAILKLCTCTLQIPDLNITSEVISSGRVLYSWSTGQRFNSHLVHCKQPRLEQVANLLCAQANSASYPQQDA